VPLGKRASFEAFLARDLSRGNTMKPRTISSLAANAEPRLPFDLGEIVVKHAFERLLGTISQLAASPSQAAGRLLSCVSDRGPARAAGLLAESFGITDRYVIEEATFATLCLDVFSHAIDDIADDPNSDNILLAHVGSLLLAKAAQTYAQLVAGNKRFWECWERYLKEASEAERFLRQDRDRFAPFEQTSFVMLGQKSALIKMNVALYASLTDGWNLQEPLEGGLMAVAAGIQLIDDLIDWEEDLDSGIHTYPVVLTTQRYHTAKSLHDTTNSSPVVVEVLDVAKLKMEEGNRLFMAMGAFSMVRFVDSLIRRLEEARTQVKWSSEPQTLMSEIRRGKQLSWIIGPRLGH